MFRSFVDPKTCCFAKISVINTAKEAKKLERQISESKTKYGIRILQERYRLFNLTFEGNNQSFEVSYTDFLKKVKSLDMYTR